LQHEKIDYMGSGYKKSVSKDDDKAEKRRSRTWLWKRLNDQSKGAEAYIVKKLVKRKRFRKDYNKYKDFENSVWMLLARVKHLVCFLKMFWSVARNVTRKNFQKI
jgi:hypothetical protein